ncbi:MAG: hypothetical protein A4E62_02987 [Syntrophorhabdus sp. PtaU1.Bin002]|nr:MAG: hypothetical protein A4E62_02987 [Syntrophorhabdus sp. PtaU1.Bin002]
MDLRGPFFQCFIGSNCSRKFFVCNFYHTHGFDCGFFRGSNNCGNGITDHADFAPADYRLIIACHF